MLARPDLGRTLAAAAPLLVLAPIALAQPVVIYDSTKAHGITLADGQKGTGQKLKIVVKEYPGGGYGVTYQPVRKGTGNNKK